MKRLYPLLLLSLLFIGCSDKHDDQPNSPAVQLYELHYTTIDEKVVEPYRDDFGADIVSNTYNDGVGIIAFDSPITTIGERVFYNCSTLESITIPSSVISIGSEAFYRCDCLKAFKGKYATPDGRALIIDETLCYIAPSGLTDYTIPSDVKTLGRLSFAYCTELVTVKIPSSVTAIGSEAFYACTSIEGVTLPESVVSLGALSFAECDHLSEVYVQQSTPPTGGDDMFDGNAADRKIYVPIGSGSTYKMANGWKEYSASIEEYDFNPVPDVVIKEATVAEFIAAEVGDATIYELTGVIQNIQNVEYGNFDLVDATGSVYIYGLTDESGEKVFEALGLKEGDTVTLRGTRSAYKDTPEVKGAIYVSHVACHVPSEQTNYEIWYTSSDGKVVEPYRSAAFDANIISNIYENGKGVITFDGEVTTIDNYAFYGCRLLTSVTLPSSVTTLGFQIFYDCDGITSITIPESVTTIEGGAFTGCDNLSEFKGKYATKDGHCLIIGNTLHSFVSVGVDTYVVPAGVTRIEDYAFYDTSISDVTFPDGLTYIGVSTFAYCSDIEALTLPSSITHISSAAFCQCSSLTSITIPEYVEFIGDRAFLSCESLLEIYSKPTTPPTGDDYMFEGNSADRKIYVPVQSYSAYVSKEHWRDYADYIVGYDFEKGEVVPEGQRNNEIWYTSSDGNIVRPHTSNVFGATIVSNTYEDGKGVITFDGAVTTIGNEAFYECKKLTSVTIPDSVTTIGFRVFYYCRSLTSVTIGDSVTTIGTEAFWGCDNLTSVTIGDSVATIGYRAFSDCNSLTSVTIPDSVTTIGGSAFAPCYGLTSVYCKATTPPSIDYGVFNDNAKSRKIYVPTASVNDYKSASGWRGYANYIVGYDFEKGEVAVDDPVLILTSEAEMSFLSYGGNGEISYIINNPVESLSVIVSCDAQWITNFVVSSNKIKFTVAANDRSALRTASITVKYGVLSFMVDVTQDAKAGQADNEIWYTSLYGNIVTPYRSNVFGATIVSNTYEDGKGVITFDGAVTTIGELVFYDCDSLTSVTIPDSVTTIGGSAFRNCNSLTSVTIPDSVTTIGALAFYDCYSLTSVTIPDSVTTIGYNAFSDCDSLTSVTIGDSVTTIGYGAFDSCSSITSVIIGDSVITIGERAFEECESLTSVTIGDSVTTIGNRAFSDCNSLTSVTIPDSVTTIGDRAFYSCDSLTSVTIGDSVTTIGELAFYDCNSLTSVTIPDSVTTIGESTFESCDSLTSITIGDSVTTIGEWAFGHCDSLTSVTIPDSVTTIGTGAFGSCDSLKEFKGKYATDNGRCLIVDNTLIAYAEASGTEYTIPDSVTTIGGWAFYYCESLTSVTIGDSVTTIGGSAFRNCNSLTSVYCKATTPPSIGDYVFYDNADNRKIYVPTASVNDYKTADGWRGYAGYIVGYDFEKGEVAPEGQRNNEIWYTSSDGNIVTPDTSSGFGATIVSNTYEDGKGVITFDGAVTAIGKQAFSNCDSLTSVTIPDSVTTIGDSAFNGCSSLTSVTIPDSVTTIGDEAFYSCDSLTSVTIPDSVTTIGPSAFSHCDSLISVTIPDSVTTIGDYAFAGCDSLTCVTIPDSVTTIGGGAFAGCPLIKEFKGKYATDNGRCLIVDNTLIAYAEASGTEYTIPDSVTTIGDDAFYYCRSLTSVTIPDSVTTIGNYAFFYCLSLTSVTIPDSVTTIGNYAFFYCRSLTSVYCKATTPPSIGSDVFGYNANSRTIYVPTASVNDYKTADGWRDYTYYILVYDF